MTRSTQYSNANAIRLGGRAITRNQFLVVLAGLAGIAWAIAALAGRTHDSGRGWLDSALSPHMIWAYLLVGIAVFGFARLKQAGEPGTAYQCLIIGGGFIIGAAMKTFFS